MQKDLFYENFKKQLINRGFKEGDTILLTCDILKFLLYFRKKKNGFDANKFLDLFIEIIGKRGTLILNAFNWDFCKGKDFDILKSPARTGSLSNIALKRKDFLRSKNPIYSFVCCGYHAEEISLMEHDSCFSFKSPFGFMINKNAKNLFINLDYKKSGFTFLHVAEEYQKISYRFFKEFKGNIIKENSKKEVVVKMFVRNLETKTKAIILETMDEELIKKNAMEKFKINHFNLSTINLKKTFEIFKNELVKKKHIKIINS